MFPNFCLCSSQDGYPHNELCPFPYFGNDPKKIDEWTAQWIANEKAIEHGVHPTWGYGDEIR